MLRLACCLATERHIRVCAPVHDALLIEAPLDALDDVVSAVQDQMAEASRLVLDGFVLRSDAYLIRYPDRFADERGRHMWGTVWNVVDENRQTRVCAGATLPARSCPPALSTYISSST